jgi:ATP-dependent helicase/DNAse subunit B
VTREKLEALLKDKDTINAALDKAFYNVVFDDETGTGKRQPEGYNLIIRQVIYTYIMQFIRSELGSCPFTIMDLEQSYQVNIPVSFRGARVNLKVGGIIDRIDRQGGKIRILDYKTGKENDKFLSVESLFDGSEKLRNDAAFQVLLYSYVYHRIHPEETIVPGLFFLRRSHALDFSSSITMGKTVIDDFAVIEAEFEERLKAGLATLFNLNVPFSQTTNLKACKFCPYAMICRREGAENR